MVALCGRLQSSVRRGGLSTVVSSVLVALMSKVSLPHGVGEATSREENEGVAPTLTLTFHASCAQARDPAGRGAGEGNAPALIGLARAPQLGEATGTSGA